MAAHATNDDSAINTLCAVHVGGAVKKRSYAADFAPEKNSQQGCVVVEISGGDGCAASSGAGALAALLGLVTFAVFWRWRRR
ncbi:MAG TPA: MYXO-CTERM sorting domain-containing protein [Kofleriaceae bacterium]|nr:MYXO-CTERM sorting domain-containing protein [Kofleriaceae bacterium]